MRKTGKTWEDLFPRTSEPTQQPVTRDSEPTYGPRPRRTPKKAPVTRLSYFNLTGAQNYLAGGASGSEDNGGLFAQLNLDRRSNLPLLGDTRLELFGDIRSSYNKRKHRVDPRTDLSMLRAGLAKVLADTNGFYADIGFTGGLNYVDFVKRFGGEPGDIRSASVGVKARAAAKGVVEGFAAAEAGKGDYANFFSGDREPWTILNGSAGVKLHLDSLTDILRGVSVGAEVRGGVETNRNFTGNEDLEIKRLNTTGYVELKNFWGKGLSGWAMVTHKYAGTKTQSNNRFEGGVRFTKDLGKRWNLGLEAFYDDKRRGGSGARAGVTLAYGF